MKKKFRIPESIRMKLMESKAKGWLYYNSALKPKQLTIVSIPERNYRRDGYIELSDKEVEQFKEMELQTIKKAKEEYPITDKERIFYQTVGYDSFGEIKNYTSTEIIFQSSKFFTKEPIFSRSLHTTVEEEVERIAKACHEVNRIYCQSIGDYSQPEWSDAPEWQKNSAYKGVIYHLKNPNSKPFDSHNSWMDEKEKNGWKYGKVKNPDKKEHPCMVKYEDLPEEQKIKDKLFMVIVEQFIICKTCVTI